MLTRESLADALPCQRRVAVRWLAAGVLLPAGVGWAGGAQAQIGLSSAINHAGWFRALSQRMAKAYCQQYLRVLSPAAGVNPRRGRENVERAGPPGMKTAALRRPFRVLVWFTQGSP